jgi:predicted DNA-binding transcriptional regulator YafY
MERQEKIRFSYFSPNGESEREIEPYHLIFQWSSWYVWGYCMQRNDWRMFKLTRMTALQCTGKKREKREVPEYTSDKLLHTKGEIEAIVKFDKSVRWRLVDEWGSNTFEEDEDGNLIVRFTWSDTASFYNWILTFGAKAEILEPESYRREFAQVLADMQKKYEL